MIVLLTVLTVSCGPYGLALLLSSVWYAKSQVRDKSALRQRIRDIAMSRPRFGYLFGQLT